MYGEGHAYTNFLLDTLLKIREQVGKPMDHKVINGFFVFKHDVFHRPPSPGDGPTHTPNEFYFIRPFGDQLEDILQMTGRMLRLEEYESISGRFAGLPPTGAEGHAYSARDFFALCRGEDIVSENFSTHL